jgi:hypothetical protein
VRRDALGKQQNVKKKNKQTKIPIFLVTSAVEMIKFRSKINVQKEMLVPVSKMSPRFEELCHGKPVPLNV